MSKNPKHTWTQEVQDALKHYQDALELERQPAYQWPAVQKLIERGIGGVPAIRRVLDQAIAQLAVMNVEGANLLREHYLRGRSIDALADNLNVDVSHLHRKRNKLVAELAVEVAEQNRLAARSSRAQRFMVPQPVVGFDRIASELAACLRDPAAPPVLVLEGMGGLGKTTLARLIAQELADDDTFTQVLWTTAKQVDFDLWGGKRRVVQPRALNPDDLLLQIADELGITVPGDLAAVRNEVRAHCKRSPYLIIFDNLETVADMAALAPLIDLLVCASRVLITTRDRAFEALPATLVRHYVPLAELDAATSYRLLRSAATFTGAQALTNACDEDLAQIYAITGGNPLALWLVAGQARGMPWATFIRDLVECCPAGSTGYELFDYLYGRSWEQLTPDARTVLFAMHRCETGADYHLLFALSRLEHAAFQQAVEDLGNRMLLQFDGRYHIHRLTYTFLRVVIAGWWE